MSYALKILFITIALVIIYKLVFSGRKGTRTLFEMKFKDGRLVSHYGKIPDRFAKDCRQLAKSAKLTCVVRAQQRDRKVQLHVSANVGDRHIQQLQALFPRQYYTQTAQ
ncbi:DUF3634 family protein [Shewanella sp. YIC-542]|uniref:DUF3634 family protein n=1 Tax=Shewanella mytili TaxID=3377111 RepID=UPI00398ED1A6